MLVLRPGVTNNRLWNPVRPPEAEWKRLRQQVLERCNHTCAGCGHRALKWMNLHHLLDSGDNTVGNLVPVCVACHAVLHVGRSLEHEVVQVWQSRMSQAEIVRTTRNGVAKGRSLLQIKKDLHLVPGPLPADSEEYANNLIRKMGSKPRAYLDEPLCAVFVNLKNWQL